MEGLAGANGNRPRRHWLDAFVANDVPCGPVRDYTGVAADSQVRRTATSWSAITRVSRGTARQGSPCSSNSTSATGGRRSRRCAKAA